MFLHHLIISIFVLGIFITEYKFIQIHLVAASLVIILWFSLDGCFLNKIQKEFIKYSPNDEAAIHGVYSDQARNQLLVGVPIILYDFYKLLL
jgi:hypothetical protein